MDKYVGEKVSQLPHGKGVYYYPNGFVYEGEWVRGKKQGIGTLTMGNWGKYEGNFVAGEIQGNGTQHYSDGSVFQGDFVLGCRNGQGKHNSANETYEGQWIHNQRDGFGILTCKDESTYVGEWKRNQRNGSGKQTYSDGLVYEGNWLNNKRTNFGVLRNKSGKVLYEGEWNNDCFCGEGKWFSESSNIFHEGKFENGLPVLKASEFSIRLLNTKEMIECSEYVIEEHPEEVKPIEKTNKSVKSRSSMFREKDKLINEPSDLVSEKRENSQTPNMVMFGTPLHRLISFAIETFDGTQQINVNESGRVLSAQLSLKTPASPRTVKKCFTGTSRTVSKREFRDSLVKKRNAKHKESELSQTIPFVFNNELKEKVFGEIVNGKAIFSGLCLDDIAPGEYEIVFADETQLSGDKEERIESLRIPLLVVPAAEINHNK